MINKTTHHFQDYLITSTTIRMFGFAIWASSIDSKGGWFRLFGIGLAWKHKTEELMFSERMGYTKFIMIGDWILKPLRMHRV